MAQIATTHITLVIFKLKAVGCLRPNFHDSVILENISGLNTPKSNTNVAMILANILSTSSKLFD